MAKVALFRESPGRESAMRYSKLVLTVLVTALSAASVQAKPLFDFPSQSELFAPDSMTLGYSFAVSQSITVDGIGLFDDNDDIQSVHELGLWDFGDKSSDPVLLVLEKLVPGSSTKNFDPSASGDGNYVYVDITPLILEPGDYVLGAGYQPENANRDKVVSMPDSVDANSPHVTYGAGVYAWPQSGSNIVFPDMPSGLNYFGPALRIAESLPIAAPLTLAVVTVPIPEPVTLALTAIGIAGVGFGRRRRS